MESGKMFGQELCPPFGRPLPSEEELELPLPVVYDVPVVETQRTPLHEVGEYFTADVIHLVL